LDRFPTRVDDELKCSICHMVFENPVESPYCQHPFCAECIEGWLNQSSQCPTCRKFMSSIDLKPVHRLVRNILSNLDIKCDFANESCEEIVRLGALEAHTRDCDFNPAKKVKCQKGCDLMVPRKELKGHVCLLALKNTVKDLREKVNKEKMNQDLIKLWASFSNNLMLLRSNNSSVQSGSHPMPNISSIQSGRAPPPTTITARSSRDPMPNNSSIRSRSAMPDSTSARHVTVRPVRRQMSNNTSVRSARPPWR